MVIRLYTRKMISDFTSKLLFWYDKRARKFPWRDSNNSYKIWLAEVMLQQTQVNTVIPFYNNWVQAFPDIKSVAVAKEDYILKKWEGLGYYSRALNFHTACKIIMHKYCGNIPKDIKKISALPGVGPYIASAVMSIAFNESTPAVDTNAYRVVSRLRAINVPFSKCKNKIKHVLSDLISKERPGDFNQAIMDLGREVCTAKNPSCNICPICNSCNAFANNTVNKYPVKLNSIKKPHYPVAVGIIWNKNKLLISKRKKYGLLGGLWEFPGGKIKKGEGAKQCIIREVREELGIYVQPSSFLKQINHSYSHFSITIDAYHCKYIRGAPKAIGCVDWQWIFPEQIAEFPFPKANHKLFDQIEGS